MYTAHHEGDEDMKHPKPLGYPPGTVVAHRRSNRADVPAGIWTHLVMKSPGKEMKTCKWHLAPHGQSSEGVALPCLQPVRMRRA